MRENKTSLYQSHLTLHPLLSLSARVLGPALLIFIRLGQGMPWQLTGTHEQHWEVPGACGPAGQIDGCFRKSGTVWQVDSSAEERRSSRSWSWVTWSPRSSGSLPTSLPFSPASNWGGCGPVSLAWQPAERSLKGVLRLPCLPFQSCPGPVLVPLLALLCSLKQ